MEFVIQLNLVKYPTDLVCSLWTGEMANWDAGPVAFGCWTPQYYQE